MTTRPRGPTPSDAAVLHHEHSGRPVRDFECPSDDDVARRRRKRSGGSHPTRCRRSPVPTARIPSASEILVVYDVVARAVPVVARDQAVAARIQREGVQEPARRPSKPRAALPWCRRTSRPHAVVVAARDEHVVRRHPSEPATASSPELPDGWNTGPQRTVPVARSYLSVAQAPVPSAPSRCR